MIVISASLAVSALCVTPSLARTLVNRVGPAPEAYSFIDQNGAQSVVRWDGHVVGADPDESIRFQLMRDGFADEN
jgi:hypothetical protein